MKRKLISYICLMAIFMESVPVNALSNIASEVIPLESLETSEMTEETQPAQESTEQEDENLNDSEVVYTETKDDDSQGTEAKPKLEDNVFNMYILDKIDDKTENELAFSIGFDEKESKLTLSNQSEKQLSKENLDTIIYKINIYDKENKEKLNIELLGSDTGNSDKLNILKETKYEIGDTIKITSFDAKNGLNILGEINGDIKKEKQTNNENEKVEDYSNGVDNLDFLDNVRFEITKTNLKTVYNNAPVFEGLTDLLDVESPEIDVLNGVKVTDDHDGTIDNSKIVVQVKEKTETSAILTYTVEDSWGRSTSATRNIAAKAKVDAVTVTDDNSSKNAQTSGIASNIITVEGVPYFGNVTERFKIKFDTASKSIKIIDADGRVFSNIERGDYFKIALYDKDMEVKASATLLGSEKSDSEKLEAINNCRFEEGDYIGIWHAESDTKLKIAGDIKATTTQNGQADPNGQIISYANGVPKREISERRFRIKNTGLEEVNNTAPVIGELAPIQVTRGENKDLLEGVAQHITDDFDTFDQDNIDSGYVSITHSKFDNTKVGQKTITYTATDRWGKSSTKERTVTVVSQNPLDYTYIEFTNPNNPSETLFRINIDPVEKKLVVDNFDNLPDTVIDSGKSSSIFKLKVYTQSGVLQKTLSIKGTDKLKTVLRRINGYKYNENDRIEFWSTTPKSIRVIGDLVETNSTDSTQNIPYVSNENVGNGGVSTNYREDYTNGIDNQDYMKNVRFEIGSSNLKYIFNEAPKITINTELIVPRKGKVNYMEGISVSDDHDDETELLKKVTHTEIDTSTIGEKYAEYTAVDSWGRSTLIKRKITVCPENNLSYNYITIKNNQTNEAILSIRFDEDNKKFKVDKLDVSKIPSSLSDNDKLLELKLIKKNNNIIFKLFKFLKSKDNIETITITKQDLINNNLNQLENLRYSYGDYLSFNSYDHANGIFISAKSHILLNGFDDEDQMDNTRFEIKSEGLQMTYNNAPTIMGLEDTLYLYKGEQLTKQKALEGVSVKDDLDNIEASSIKVKYEDDENLGNVDTNNIDDIVLNYEVTDSWGRSFYGTRFVSIISKSVSNDIEFYDERGNNKLFSLKYNPISNEFDVTRNTQVTTRTEENPETKSQPQKNVVFRLNVFNDKGELVGKLELSEDDLLNPDSFNELSNIGVYDDYYFSVWSDNSSRIKIQGDIAGNNRLGESEKETEDYSNGISNSDHMDNVRFKLKTDGLEAVYNKAPKIIIKSKNILTAYAGDPIDYTSNIIVEDDHDKTIPNEKIVVDKVKDNTEDTLRIGENTVNLSVKDSWGRESKIERKILITNGIDKNTIRIVQHVKTDNPPVVLEIGFDHITKKLVINHNDIPFTDEGPSGGYVKFKVERRDQNGNLQEIVPLTDFNAVSTPNECVQADHDGFLNCNIHSHEKKIDRLKNYTYKEGDLITFIHHHPVKFRIDGRVIDAREDYSDGVQNPENIRDIKFEITNSGLKAVYTDPDVQYTTDNNAIIGPMAPEKFPFKLQVNIAERKFKVVDENNNHFLYNQPRNVYKLVHIPKNGDPIKETDFHGNAHLGWRAKREGWDNRSFEYGDYIYIWHLEPKRSIIKGNIIDKREDYSDGVDDPDNMNNVIFEITPQGLKSIYNKAPEITGADDIDVYQNSTFNLLDRVKFTDEFDTGHLNITVNGQTVTTEADGTVSNSQVININTSNLGVQTFTYRATDRWGNTTEIQRRVTVRPNLYKNVFKVFSDDNQQTPIFEIGFDSITNKYRVFNQTNERISPNNLSETAFEINIIGSNKKLKKKVNLKGSDRGNSPQLNELNNVDYAEGDIIRVFRRNLYAINIVGDITGHIPQPDQIVDDTDKFDYMLNTGFKVRNSGLEAVYNQAPEINGVIADKTINKGETLNLLDGIQVHDDIDTLDKQDIDIYINDQLIDDASNHTFDRIGTYNIKYILYDNWGRGVLKELTITVESKVRENGIEVYDSSNNLVFKVTFDTTNNQFVLKGNQTSTTYNPSSNQNKYFEMIVRNIKGEEKYRVTLNGDITHDTQELTKIHQMSFDRYDTIALYGETVNTVKIKGGVIQEANHNLSNIDYSNGFGNTDRYKLVRFKITDDGLKEIIQKQMLVSGLGDKTIKRGNNIDFLDGVVVNVQDTNNEDYKIKVDSQNFNNLKEGQYTVTYTITNSWGQRIERTRTITVDPRTELEEVKLKVKNNNGQVILTIGFDSIERKLRVINYIDNSTIDSSNTNLAFAINAYDTIGNTLGTIELDGDQIIDQSLIDRLNNFAYIEGYRISIWAKNPQQHLEVEGNITSHKNNNLIGKDEVDKMENGRFEILSNGLEYIYNEAPVISGGDNAIDYYKGTLLEIPKDISVKDDHDGTINSNLVIIDDDKVDYDILGNQDIVYIVEDSWGRVGEKKAKIHVISSIDKNEINIYTTQNNINTNDKIKAFSIAFKREADKSKITISNEDNTMFNSNVAENEVFMTIKVHDTNGKVIKECKLLSGENAVNNQKLAELKDLELDIGSYISIDNITNGTKECMRIIGTVVNERESYIDGVNELDNIQNVRFKVTDFGLESVYNQAPTITINKNISLDTSKGDDIPYMRGIRLTDDHDKLTKANVEVTWNPKEIPNGENEQYNDFIKGVAKVGLNTLHYKVTDSWGRTCEADRSVNLTNGMLKNEIIFNQSVTGDEVMKINFTTENDGIRLNFTNTGKQFAVGYNQTYYRIKLHIPNAQGRFDVHDINLIGTDTGDKRDLDVLKRVVPYGTMFEFYAFHPTNLVITGGVRNQREDYSDGAQNVENYTFVKFKVTDSGLESIYTEGDSISKENNENIISVASIESIPVKFKVNPATRKISIYNRTNIELYHELRTEHGDIPVFRMTLNRQNGDVVSVEANASDRGINSKFNVFNFDENTTFDYGDTLTIWHYTPSRISIKGKEIKGAREDYSDGVDNEANLTEAVFKLTVDGLEAQYKDAPKVTGVKDTKVLKGQTIDLRELTKEILANDNIDGNITHNVICDYSSLVGQGSRNDGIFTLGKKSSHNSQGTTSSNGPSLDIDEIAVPNKVGMYEVRYRVTNTNNRTTEKSSTVVVYDRPTIEASDRSRIELNSLEDNDDVIREYLLDTVAVTDDDDILYGKETKVELLSHNVKPNQEGIYEAVYKATDFQGTSAQETIDIPVSKTINVSVPINMPFQVVTNLKDKTADSFISGVMKIKNNNEHSGVNVFIDSFTRQNSNTNNVDVKNLEIVKPDYTNDWDNLPVDESMTKMALGIYHKDGLVDKKIDLTKDNPLWLDESITSTQLGALNKAESLSKPYESKLSFTSKHGKNFIGGRSKGKFNLVFRFE